MLPVSHIAVPLLSLAIYNRIRKARGKIVVPSFCFIVIGLAGVLPDLLNPHFLASERVGFSHSIFFPLFFLIIYFILKLRHSKNSIYPFLFFAGLSIHLVLDIITGQMEIFYPLSNYTFDSLVLFPAILRKINNIWYAHFQQYTIWYLFDFGFIALYIIVEKAPSLKSIRNFIFRNKGASTQF